MPRTISIAELQDGMFLVGYGKGTAGEPIVIVERNIEASEILALTAQGVTEVEIDDDRGTGPSSEYSDSTARGIAIYRQTLGYVRGFMDGARAGDPVSYSQAAPFIRQVVNDCLTDDSRLRCIAKLKQFDEYTYSHCLNVCILGVVFGSSLGLPGDDLTLLGAAGLFHDLGKSRIPLSILNKPGKLEDFEFEIMRSHPTVGHELLCEVAGVPEVVRLAALEHHERYSGNGYPERKPSHAQGRLSQIIAICDCYDAMTADRVYRQGRTPIEVLSIMYGWRGKDFAPQLVDQFIKCMGVYPEGTLVRLSDDRLAVVVANNRDKLLKPVVMLLEKDGEAWAKAGRLDLTAPWAEAAITRVEDPAEFGLDGLAFL